MPRLVASHVPAGTLRSIPQPRIDADGLLLRPWEESHADALMAAFQDPDIQRWHVRSIASRSEAVDMIAAYNAEWHTEANAHWAVVAGSQLVGRAALREIDLYDGCAQIAYWVPPAARGRGVATRASVALTMWAFEELGLHRIGLNHAVANTASCRVAQKAGFAAEGIKRSAWLHADGFHDAHMHARVIGDPAGASAGREEKNAQG